MFVSVRDSIVLEAWPTIGEGLRELALDAVEFSFDRECKVCLVTPSNGEAQMAISDPAGAEKFHAHLDASGVRATSFLMATDFGSDDLDGEIQWVVNAIRAAERVGADCVRIDAIMSKEKEWPLDKRIAIFADSMKRVLDATSGSKVDMGIENHGFQGNTPEFLDRVLSAVADDRLGLTIDTGNFYWRGHPLDRVYEILEHFAPRTKHTHCKNLSFPPEMRNIEREAGWRYNLTACELRKGDIDHIRVAKLLKDAGYDRDLCLEDEAVCFIQDRQRKRAMLIDDACHLREAVARAGG